MESRDSMRHHQDMGKQQSDVFVQRVSLGVRHGTLSSIRYGLEEDLAVRVLLRERLGAPSVQVYYLATLRTEPTAEEWKAAISRHFPVGVKVDVIELRRYVRGGMWSFALNVVLLAAVALFLLARFL
jgi:hypothetical protein